MSFQVSTDIVYDMDNSCKHLATYFAVRRRHARRILRCFCKNRVFVCRNACVAINRKLAVASRDQKRVKSRAVTTARFGTNPSPLFGFNPRQHLKRNALSVHFTVLTPPGDAERGTARNYNISQNEQLSTPGVTSMSA